MVYVFVVVVLMMWVLWWCGASSKTCQSIQSFRYTDPWLGPSTYRIYLFDHFLTAKECEVLRRCATPYLRRSITLAGLQASRTSDTYFIKPTDLTPEHQGILQKIKQFTATNTHTSIHQQEQLQVCRYKKGQFYKSHFDACDPYEDKQANAPSCQQDNAKHGGARYATLLIYLNDVVSGGETYFSSVHYKCKPKTGRAVLFYNLTRTDRPLPRPHPLSKHAALPVKDGEKWVCNQWVRLPFAEN